MSATPMTKIVLLRRLALTTALCGGLLAFAAPAQADTTPGQKGNFGNLVGTASNPGTTLTLDVNGTGDAMTVRADGNAILNWNSFNILQNNSASYQHLNGNGAAKISILNRVTGGTATNIDGMLTSGPNVNVYIINPNGVLFGANARVNVGGLVASTLDATDADFLNGGNLDLTSPGSSTGIAVSAGAILTSTENLVLLGGFVRNDGALAAQGDLATIAANAVDLDIDGGLINFSIRDGTTVRTALTANGTISGKNVFLAYATRAGVTDALLSIGGTVTANSAVATDSGIVLSAGDGWGVGLGAATSGNAKIAQSAGSSLKQNGASNGVTMTARNDIALAGDVQAAETISIQGKNISAANLNGEYVGVSSQSSLNVQNLVAGAQGANLAGTDVVIGTITSGKMAYLTATAGDISVNGAVNTATDFSVNASGAATVAGNVTAGGQYTAIGQSVILGTAGQQVVQQAASMDLSGTDMLDGKSGLTLKSSGDINVTSRLFSGSANIDTTGDLVIRSLDNLSAISFGDVKAKGIGYYLGGTLGNVIDRNNDITFGNLTLQDSLEIRTIGKVTTGNVAISGGYFVANLNNGGDIKTGNVEADFVDLETAFGSVTTGDLTGRNGFFGDIQVIGDTVSVGNVTALVHGANLQAKIGNLSAGTVTTKGDVTASSDFGTVTLAGLNSQGDASLTALGNGITMTGAADVSGLFSVDTSGDFTFTDVAAGNIAINATGAAAGHSLHARGPSAQDALAINAQAVDADSIVTDQGALNIVTDDLKARALTILGGNAYLKVAGTATLGTLRSDGDVNISASQAIFNGQGDVAGTLSVAADNDIIFAALKGGRVDLSSTAGSIVGVPGSTIVATATSAVPDDFVLSLSAGQDVKAGRLEALNGSIYADAGGDLVLGSVEAARKAGLYSLGNIEAAGLLKAGILILNNGNGNIATNDVEASDLSIMSTGTVSVGNINAGSLRITANELNTADINATNSFDILTTGDATMGNVANTSSITIKSTTGNVTMASASASVMFLTALQGEMKIGGLASSPGGISIGAQDISLNKVNSSALDAQASGRIAIGGNVSLSSFMKLKADSVELGMGGGVTQTVNGDIDITATHAIKGGAGLTLASGALGGKLILDGEQILFAADSMLRTNDGVIGIRVAPGATQKFGNIHSAQLKGVQADHSTFGDLFVTGPATFGDLALRDSLVIRNSDGLTINSASVTGTNQSIDLSSTNGDLNVGDLAAASSITLRSSQGTINLNGDVLTTDLALNGHNAKQNLGIVSATRLTGNLDGSLDLSGQNRIDTVNGFKTVNGMKLSNAIDLELAGTIDGSGGDVAIRTVGVLDLAPGAVVKGRVVSLSTADAFLNESGANAVQATDHWVIYAASPDPAANVFGGLDSNNTAIWNATADTLSPTQVQGNHYVFAYTPTLTFTTKDLTKTYGDAVSAAQLAALYNVTGLEQGVAGAFKGDTLADVVSGTPVVASAGADAKASVAGGPYTVTIENGSLTTLSGYRFAFNNNGKITINRKALNANVAVDNKTYDGTTAANGSISFGGVLAGDDVGNNVTFAFADKNAGSGKTVTISGGLTGADAGNYTLTLPASAIADILKKAVSVSVTVNDKTYDGTTAASGQMSLNGKIAGDDLSATGGTFTFSDQNAGKDKLVTVSGITIGGADAGNYEVTIPASALADILRRAITVKADDAQKLPNDPDPALTYAIVNGSLVAGDSFTGSLSREPGEATGRYKILQGSLALSDNYEVTYQPGTFQIGLGVSINGAVLPDVYETTELGGRKQAFESGQQPIVWAAAAQCDPAVAEACR